MALKRTARSAIVEHSTAEVYALVDDIESYPEFLPWCRDAKVLQRGPKRTVATLTVGVRGVRQSFTTENANRPGEAIDLRLVEGPFRSFSAAWRFTPLGEYAARIEFSMEYEFSNKVLAKVLEPLFDRIADTMVTAFSRRADRLHGKAAG
ncbi:MAG: type II toxin-antitoxin system RatA family toxin [Burkholderiales bacterium]